jgi:hypothetical protein
MSNEEPREYMQVNIPTSLLLEVDKRIGLLGFRSRAEIVAHAVRTFIIANPLPSPPPAPGSFPGPPPASPGAAAPATVEATRAVTPSPRPDRGDVLRGPTDAERQVPLEEGVRAEAGPTPASAPEVASPPPVVDHNEAPEAAAVPTAAARDGPEPELLPEHLEVLRRDFKAFSKSIGTGFRAGDPGSIRAAYDEIVAKTLARYAWGRGFLAGLSAERRRVHVHELAEFCLGPWTPDRRSIPWRVPPDAEASA